LDVTAFNLKVHSIFVQVLLAKIRGQWFDPDLKVIRLTHQANEPIAYVSGLNLQQV